MLIVRPIEGGEPVVRWYIERPKRAAGPTLEQIKRTEASVDFMIRLAVADRAVRAAAVGQLVLFGLIVPYSLDPQLLRPASDKAMKARDRSCPKRNPAANEMPGCSAEAPPLGGSHARPASLVHQFTLRDTISVVAPIKIGISSV